MGAKTFAFGFAFLGLLGFFPIVAAFTKSPIGVAALPFVIIPLVFVGVGGALLVEAFRTQYFDLSNQSFCKGSKNKAQILCDLNDIMAIQILCEWVRGQKSSYHSYELNLVLKDGSRINVMDHGSLKSIQQDAQQIVEFLCREIPVWDSTLPQYQRESLAG